MLILASGLEWPQRALSALFALVLVVLIAVAVGVDPLIPGLVATAAAGYGLMLPVSTPPNAIVYGSGMVPLTPCCAAGSCSTSSVSRCW